VPYSFSVERYEEIVRFLKNLPKDISILDVGCGTGNILEFIREETQIKKVYGLDIDENALEVAKERGLEVYRCSIVDDCVEKIGRKFDVVIIGAVLHHLVSETRSGSIELARKALLNSVYLLKDDGYLVILEPTFEPFWLLTFVFYLKRFLSLFTSKRITIFNYWNNIGPPVVSYFSNSKLVSIIESFKNLLILKTFFKERDLDFLQKLFFLRSYEVTIIAKKCY
jgi:SAM-dependent methyltransferase